MKRKIRISLLIVLLFLILNAAVISAIIFSSTDKIAQSEKIVMENTTLYNHVTENREKIEISLTVNSRVIGEDAYLYEIILNSRDSARYNAKNARLKCELNDNTDILSLFYSGNGPDYTIPDIEYAENNKSFECDSDKCYIYVKMLLSGEKAEEANLSLQYDIIGNGAYSFNKFYGLKDDLGNIASLQ